MSDGINLCFVDMMHHCSFDHWDQQQHCKYVEKNRFINKCTHCQFDEFCQNLDAYPTAKTVRVKAEDLPKIVDRGEGVWGDSILDQVKKAGKILDDAEAPKENRMLNDRITVRETPNVRYDYYNHTQFIKDIIHYALWEIEGRGLSDKISFIRYEERPSEVSYNRDVLFIFDAKGYDRIYNIIQLDRDQNSAKIGRDMAFTIIKHYRKFWESRKRYKW